MSPLQRFRWQADTPRATRPSWWYHHTSQSPMASNSGANTPSSSRGRRLLLLHCTLFQGSVVSEVGHRRDNDNHSPSHCVILVQHGHALGAGFFYPAACISITNDVVQVSVIPVSSSVMFLWWSETAGRVLTWTLTVVRVLTLRSIATFENWVHQCSCIQH
jgi:hypothetical protein